MKCAYCSEEINNLDNCLLMDGYVYHKDCDYIPREDLDISFRQDKPATITVVFAVSHYSKTPLIYGAYEEDDKAFLIQEHLQGSKEYGHLIWSNRKIALK